MQRERESQYEMVISSMTNVQSNFQLYLFDIMDLFFKNIVGQKELKKTLTFTAFFTLTYFTKNNCGTAQDDMKSHDCTS